MAGATIVRADNRGPEEPGSDRLLLAFVRLCRQLERPASEAELRAGVEIPPDGADLACLERMAARAGFALRTTRMSARALARLPTPFLIVGREPHQSWLVRARTVDQLVLVEPTHGGTTARTRRAAVALGTHLVRLAPAVASAATSTTPRAGGFWRSALLHRVRGVLWQIGLASVVINLLALATPLFMMTVYNKVINHAALQTLDVLAIGMVTLVGFELLLRALRGYITAHTGARLEAAIGGDVMRHIVHLPLRVFEAVPGAAMLERVRQVDQLRQFLTGHLPLLIVDLAFVGLFVAVLFVLTPALALVTLAAMPAFALLSAVAQRRQTALQRAHFRAANAKAVALGETVAQALTVKSLALEADMERRFERHLLRSAVAGLRSGRIAHVASSLGQALQHLTALVLVYLGARMIVAGDLTIGALVAASILSARALAPMRQISLAWGQLQQARDAVGRLDELLAERAEHGGRPAGAELQLQGRLRAEAVSFRYPGAKLPALDGVSLEVAPGTMLGITGAPGSGKSTLTRLLLGLEVPDEGRVLLDDLDLKILPPLSYRGQIGVVPQEVQLFSGTVAENIAMGAADRSPARVAAAARFVGADEFIRRLPDDYDTVLGERGSGLSLGQRQLSAVARAVLRNPRVLVLDEATSALDAAAEAALLANVRRAGSGRTVVFVTHRPAVLEACDRVVVLERGRVARVGPPGEILAPAPARAGRGGLQAVP
jgi:ABC-type bacteriocin/lantibiotic exporter with double-glycine peptidase domain